MPTVVADSGGENVNDDVDALIERGTMKRVLAMVGQMRADFEAQARTERAALEELRAQADEPIQLPPVDLITERVLGLKALTGSPDIEGARDALKRYLKGGTITLSPDGDTYVARAEFLPLVFLMDKRATPSRGGRCLRVVARGGFEPPTFGL